MAIVLIFAIDDSGELSELLALGFVCWVGGVSYKMIYDMINRP